MIISLLSTDIGQDKVWVCYKIEICSSLQCTFIYFITFFGFNIIIILLMFAINSDNIRKNLSLSVSTVC